LRRLSPELRGGILQAPWLNHALQPTPWIAIALSSLYDISVGTVEVLAIVPKSEVDKWLAQLGTQSERGPSVGGQK
jgi:hypothetical protein